MKKVSVGPHFHQFYRALFMAEQTAAAKKVFQRMETYYRELVKEMCEQMGTQCEELKAGYTLKGRAYVQHTLKKIQTLHPAVTAYQQKMEHASLHDFFKELEAFGLKPKHMQALEDPKASSKSLKKTAQEMWQAVKVQIEKRRRKEKHDSKQDTRRKHGKVYGNLDDHEDSSWSFLDYALAGSLLVGAGGLAIMYGPTSLAAAAGQWGSSAAATLHSGLNSIPLVGSTLSSVVPTQSLRTAQATGVSLAHSAVNYATGVALGALWKKHRQQK